MASANVPNCLHQHHKDQTQEKKECMNNLQKSFVTKYVHLTSK